LQHIDEIGAHRENIEREIFRLANPTLTNSASSRPLPAYPVIL
jgi:hypothetical protein